MRNARNSQWSYPLEIGGRQTSLGILFVVLQHNQWTEGSTLVNNWSKFCLKFIKKRPGRALERGPGDQMAPGRAQKLQEDENHGSLLGCHLRAQHDPEAFQKWF